MLTNEWTCKCGYKNSLLGWEWHEVTNNHHEVQKLLKLNLIKINYKSNRSTEYILIDRERVKQIINDSESREETKEVEIDNLFNNIVGYDRLKNLLRRIIKDHKLVHVLLVGPPGSSKTEFLLEIERLEGAYMTVGSSTTKAGLADLLFEKDVKYLIIDEIEHMSTKDMNILLPLMQNQRVVETKYGRRREKISNTIVFGSANSTANMPKALLSRFLVFNFKEYTEAQHRDITVNLLTKQGFSKEYALKVAYECWHTLKSKDIRDVLKASQLATNEEELKELMETLLA